MKPNDALTPEEFQRLDELYGYFTPEQFADHLAAVECEVERNAREAFALYAEAFRRFGHVQTDVEPSVMNTWRSLGLDLALIGR